KAPPSPIAFLDLVLPVDRAVAVSPDGCLLSGPEPTEAPDQRRWKIGFAGRSQVHLTVAHAPRAGQPVPQVVVRSLQTHQRLSLEGVDADFQFDLEVLHRGATQLLCTCDPSLRPYEVHLRQLDKWEFKPSALGQPATLDIKLREPFQGGSLRIRC